MPTSRLAMSVVTDGHIRFNPESGVTELVGLAPGTNPRAVHYTTTAIARMLRCSCRYIGQLVDRGDFGEVKRMGVGETGKQHRRIEAQQLIDYAIKKRMLHLLPAELQVHAFACLYMPHPCTGCAEISPWNVGLWFSRNSAGRLVVGTLEGLSRAFEVAHFVRSNYPLSKVIVVAADEDTARFTDKVRCEGMGADLIQSSSREQFEQLFIDVQQKWNTYK